MVWPKNAWRWGAVIPSTVAALAGGLGDVITGTLQFWYLLVPSYLVIAIAIWRDMDARVARRALEAAAREADEDEAARGASNQTPLIEAGDRAMEDEPLVARPPRASVGSVVLRLAQGGVRLLAAIVVTFIYLVMIWMAIAVATWGRGYWYVYGPMLALIAWFVWHVWRSGPADAKGGDRIVR
jgi:hypothetical protein